MLIVKLKKVMDDYIEETEIPGVLIIKRSVFEDDRGFFRETFRKNDLEEKLGIEFNLLQANHSRSQRGTLRGIHIAPWYKLVTVFRGQVQQVVVDTRENSPTFGKYISIILGEKNWVSVLIPPMCGNAFLTLSDIADYNYLTTDYWAPGVEKAIIYSDSDLAINWEIDRPILSEKDLRNPTFEEVFPNQKFNK